MIKTTKTGTLIDLKLSSPGNLRAIDILSWHLILADHHRSGDGSAGTGGIDQLMLCRRLGGEGEHWQVGD